MSNNKVKITSDGITCTDCNIDVSGGNIYTDTPENTDISNIVPTTQWVSDYISSLTGIPIGGIIMWNGATPPVGWALCDGNNGTPNLSGRFVLGSGSVTDSSGNTGNYSLGQTEGQINVTLSVDEIPSHSHETAVNSKNKTDTGSEDTSLINVGDSAQQTTQLISSATGGGNSHNNMPPYYVLAYIIRIS